MDDTSKKYRTAAEHCMLHRVTQSAGVNSRLDAAVAMMGLYVGWARPSPLASLWIAYIGGRR